MSEEAADTVALPVAGKDQDDPPKTLTGARASEYWQKQIVVAEREQRAYWTEAQQVIMAYRNGRSTATTAETKKRRFNILYANVETQRGGLYGRPGKPDCRPRWSGQDQLARIGSEVMERGLTTSIDNREHLTTYKSGVLHALLTGRSVVRHDVEAETGERPGPDGLPMPAVIRQRVSKRLTRVSDFLHSPAECWADVWWIAFRHKMTRDDMRQARFANADEVPLAWKPNGADGKPDQDADDDVDRADVWEVWSKVHRKRFWIVKGHRTALRIDADPLGLSEFWPCQEPLVFHPEVAGTCIPQLDWWQYQSLADDLEEAHARIAALTKQLRYRGVYDKSVPELQKLAKAPDNTFVAVENMALLKDKGGLNKAYEVLSIEELAATLLQVMQLAEMLETKIDKMTGIADIMRGESGSKAVTATEQQIKAQYGGARIKQRQADVQTWIRDGMRIEAELMAEHFEPHILQEMTGIEITPELEQFLREDRLRSLRIDVETDSTVFEDGEEAKKANAELVASAMPLLEQAMVAMQSAPPMAEVIFEMLALTLRAMKGGRQIEEVIDRARQQMMQMMQQQQEQPKPDPEAQKAEAAMALEAKKAESAAAVEAERARAAVTMKQMELDQKAQADADRIAFEREKWEDEYDLKVMDLRERALASLRQAEESQAKAANENEHRFADREMADRHAAEAREDADMARQHEADQAERDRVAAQAGAAD